MWRDNIENREAKKITTSLRPRRDRSKQRPRNKLRLPPDSDPLVRALFESFNQTSAPMSKYGFGKYLVKVALEPKTFLVLLGAVLKDELGEASHQGVGPQVDPGTKIS
jgi:hypothetical protein